MNNSKQKKKLVEYTQTQPEQLELFSLEDESYSNTIELYDLMPKYYFGGVKREKGKTVESLPILNREFIHRKRNYKLSISPAAVQDKETGKTIYYYPSQREELIEDVIRKISTRPKRAFYFDKEVGVKFSYYEVQQELKKIGHGYSIKQIKLGIEILNKSVLETTEKEGNEISITSSLFAYVGKETKEMGGKERIVAIFNPLVTRSINQGTYRLINYNKLMKMKMQVSRWLHKRISHIFTQAAPTNPYGILLSTIVRDSGMKVYKTISERIRQVERSLKELEDNKLISKWEADVRKEKNKILDVYYLIYMSKEFIDDAKRASWFTNRLDNDHQLEDKTYDIYELREEIEDPIYSLSKTVINNIIENINTKEDFNQVSNALEAVKKYIKSKKISNPAAAVKKAIKEGWIVPQKTVKEQDLFSDSNSEQGDSNNMKVLTPVKKESQDNPTWLKIRKAIQSEFDKEDWEKWLSQLEIYQIQENELVLSAPTKFVRDWVIREFIENEDKYKILLQVINITSSKFENIKIIYV